MRQNTEYKIVVLLSVVALASNLIALTESWPGISDDLKEKFIKAALKGVTPPINDENMPDQKKGIELNDQFSYINSILEQKVKSDDPEQNFKIIPELLKARWPADDEGLKIVAALHLFQALPQVDGKCNLEVYTILHRNVNAAFGLPQWNYEKFFGKRRINKIVKQYQINHAKHCGPLYLDLFKEHVKELSQERVEFAITLLKNLMKKDGEKEASEVMNDGQKLLDFATNDESAYEVIRQPVYCLNELKRLVGNDPDARFLNPVAKTYIGRNIMEIDEEKFEPLFEKYLFQPCYEYVDKLKSVFFSADFDRRVAKTPAESNELQFYTAWAAFKVCDSFVAFKSIVKYNIIEYQNRMAKEEHFS